MTTDFDRYFGEMLPRAVRAAERLTGDRQLAEDAAVEALARAFARWPRISTLTWRDGWVLKVCCNEALRQLRRRPDLLRPVAPPDEVDALVLRTALVEALTRLPRRQRESLTLRYLADLSESDVAAALGVSRGAVKTHLHRGLAALRADSGELAMEGER